MARLPLTRGLVTLVDDDDYDYLAQWKWAASLNSIGTIWYAKRSIWIPEKKYSANISLHRVILNAPVGLTVDHVNGDGLDNRRGNLRLVTQGQNLLNKRTVRNNVTGYKGVSLVSNNWWRADIAINKKRIHLGVFGSPEEAHEAYLAGVVKYHGEFAVKGDS